MNPTKRKLRLIELIKRIDDGHDISTRDLKIILTEEEYSEFELMWNSEKDKRTAIKPKSVKDYEKLLNKWHIANARVEAYRKRVKGYPATLKKLGNQADNYLETIQEYLLENSYDDEFNSWLDRTNAPDNFSSQINADTPHNTIFTPALISSSRSSNNLRKKQGYMHQLSKRDIKRIVLEQALNYLEPSPKEPEMNEILEDIKKNRGSLKKDKFKGWKI